MNPSSYQPYKGPKLAPTPLSDHQYTGVNLDLKKHGSFTSHGAFLPPSAPTRDVNNRGDIQTTESRPILRNAPGSSTLSHQPKNTSFNKMRTKTPTYTGASDSPFSSEAEIHPSSGVPLRPSNSTMPTTTLPQHANFSQLAEHKGIHDWNNSVFDDRWLLQPEEIWNLEARRDSAVTISPGRLALSRNTPRTGDQTDGSRAESQRVSAQNAHLQHTSREAEETKKKHSDRQVAHKSTEPRHDDNREKLAASGKLDTQKGNRTNQ